MVQLIAVNYAADLMGCTPRSVLRAASEGRVRVAKEPSRHHEGKHCTLVELESLPAEAREMWLAQRRIHPVMSPPEAAAEETEAEAALPGGLSEDKLAWARFRYAIIEPLLTGDWARSLGSTLNGVPIEKKSDFVAALASQAWTKPNGTVARYSSSGIFALMRKFRDGGLAGLANDTRSDRGASKLPQVVKDFVLAAYCSGGTAKHPELRSVRQIMREIDLERDHREQLAAAGPERLLDYIHGRGEFAHMAAAGRTWAQYMNEDGSPKDADFYRFPAIAYTTVKRFVDGIPEPYTMLARRGLKAFTDNCDRTSTRDYAAIRPMQYVVFDHRRCDIFVLEQRHGRWILARQWETVAIDMRTRMVLASVMCPIPSALSVASCIRQIVLKFGLFECAYLDNGKEFVAQYIDGKGVQEGERWAQDTQGVEFADARGVLTKLGIDVKHAIPYSARSKPIEPFFRNASYFERTLAGACGNRPANRPEFLATWEREFKQWADGKVEAANHPFLDLAKFRELKDWFYFRDYNRRPHSGQAMDGRSPEQVMAAEYIERGLARRVDPRALDLLMQKRKMRVVGNGGTFVVSAGGRDAVYSAKELWLRQGERLETSYDPADLGELVVYEPGGDYICTATCDALRKMGESDYQEDIKERRRLAKQTRQAVAQMHRMAALPTAEERMQRSLQLYPAPPLTVAAGAPNAPLDPRYEAAAAARAASPLVLPARAAAAPEEELAFLEF